MSNHVLQLMVAVAITLCVGSLIPIRRIYAMLPSGTIARVTWTGLGLLIIAVAVGYGSFLRINLIEGPSHHEDWLVASMFLVASSFVFIVCLLSCNTADQVSRIDQLERAAATDLVTGLHNRRHIMTILESEYFMSRRYRSSLSILLIDIDGFKQINDVYGHSAGDTVLVEIADVLSNALSDRRMIGRYGGDEFLVVLQDADSIRARSVAERLRSVVEQTAVSCDGSPIITLTISVGVTTALGWEELPHELVSIADEALFAAKSSGRNRVCHAFEPPVKRVKSKVRVISPYQS